MKICHLCKTILNEDTIVFIGDFVICKECDYNLELY